MAQKTCSYFHFSKQPVQLLKIAINCPFDLLSLQRLWNLPNKRQVILHGTWNFILKMHSILRAHLILNSPYFRDGLQFSKIHKKQTLDASREGGVQCEFLMIWRVVSHLYWFCEMNFWWFFGRFEEGEGGKKRNIRSLFLVNFWKLEIIPYWYWTSEIWKWWPGWRIAEL